MNKEVLELYTLVSYNYPNNYNNLFLNTISDFYWSSTSLIDSNLYAWGVINIVILNILDV